MGHINEPVIQKRNIHVIDRDLYLHGIFYCCFVKCLRVDDIRKQDIRDLPLKRFISFLLEFKVDRKIYVFACSDFFRHAKVLGNPSHIVHVDFLFSVSSLKHIFQILFHPGFPDYGVHCIALFFTLLQIFRADGSCIAQNRRTCFASFVYTDAAFPDVHAGQITFHDSRRSLRRHIPCRSDRKVFLISLQEQGITHAYNVQNLFLLEFLRESVRFPFLLSILFIRL